jgi:hypothetical protein
MEQSKAKQRNIYGRIKYTSKYISNINVMRIIFKGELYAQTAAALSITAAMTLKGK